MEPARDEIHPLTSLRFVAALYVFLFHIHIRWPLATGPVRWFGLAKAGLQVRLAAMAYNLRRSWRLLAMVPA